MKKELKKRQNRMQKTLQLYNVCNCSCSGCSCYGCGSVPSSDYYNVYHVDNIRDKHTSTNNVAATDTAGPF